MQIISAAVFTYADYTLLIVQNMVAILYKTDITLDETNQLIYEGHLESS